MRFSRFFCVSFSVAFYLLVAASITHAQVGAELMLKPMPEKIAVEFQTRGQWQNRGHIQTSAASPGIQLQTYDAQARWRLTQDDLKLTLGTQLSTIQINSASTRLPDSLVDHGLALGARLGQLDHWLVSAVLGAGYNEPGPYGDGQAWYPTAAVLFATRLDAQSSLQWMIEYNGNRTLFPDLPLPAISYSHAINDQWAYTLGLPASSIVWKPTAKWRWQLDYAFAFTLDAQVHYALTPTLDLFGRFANRYDAYRLGNGQASNRRVFFAQQRLEAGVTWTPTQTVELQLAGGYAFNQSFETGFDARDTRTLADISDEPFVQVRLKVAF